VLKKQSFLTRKKALGMTMIELILVVGVFSILVSMSVPSFSEVTKNSRIDALKMDLLNAVSYTRNEAINRGGVQAILCGSSDGRNCNGRWDEGWISFVDVNDNDLKDGPDEIVRVNQSVHHTLNIRLDDFSSPNQISFDGQGSPDSVGTIIICDDRGNKKARAIILTVVGYARIAVDDDKTDNIVNNHNGAGHNVSCI